MTDTIVMDAYSEAVGSKIDEKFNLFSFGTNTRGLTSLNNNPFRRNSTVFMPNNQTTLYPGFMVPPCSFEKSCCNMPPSSSMTVSGRLKDCYDPKFAESVSRWTYNTSLPSHAKRYTTSTVGLDTTEN